MVRCLLDTHGSPASCVTVAEATTLDEQCKAMHWPLPLPSWVDWSLSHGPSDSILMFRADLRSRRTPPDVD